MGHKEHITEFIAAVRGGRGDLDAWLECNNEAECRAAIIGAIEEEREACKEVCRAVGARYPTDIWPEDGQSVDCKAAKMARLTAANCEREIDMRSNAALTGRGDGQ